MGKATDQKSLDLYRDVLLKFGHVADVIQWKRQPREWVARELTQVTIRSIHQEMQKYVAAGGEIDQVVEKRPEYVAAGFHYDLRMCIAGRNLYIETVFERADEIDDCTIIVVSIHPE